MLAHHLDKLSDLALGVAIVSLGVVLLLTPIALVLLSPAFLGM